MRRDSKVVDEPYGIGGWLLVFILGIAFNTYRNLARAGEVADQFKMWHMNSEYSLIRPITLFETFYLAILVLGGIAGLGLILTGNRLTPKYFRILLLSWALIAAMHTALSYAYIDQVRARPPVGLDSAKLDGMADQIRRQDVSVVMIGIVWSLYWLRSRRVKNTFGIPIPQPETESPTG